MQHEVGIHARNVLEKRNAAFRVLYNTVFEVEGVSEQEVFRILCRNLRKLAQAQWAGLASYRPGAQQLDLRAVDCDSSFPPPSSMALLPVSVPIETDMVEVYRYKQVRACSPNNICLTNIFREIQPSPFPSHVSGKRYSLSCVREHELVAVGVIQLQGDQRLRMKDMLDTYLNLAGMIIQRMNAVNALRESEARARVLWENARAGIVLVDPVTKRIEELNEIAAQIMRAPRKHILGRQCYEFFYSDDPNKRVCPVMDKGRAIENIEQDLIDAYGTRHTLLKTVTKVKLNGRAMLLETFLDITQHKMLETQLRQAQKLEAIGQLAAGMAHEINTPIQYVSDNLRFLHDAYLDILKLQDKCIDVAVDLGKGAEESEALSAIRHIMDELEWRELKEEIPGAIAEALNGTGQIARIVRAMKAFAAPDVGFKQEVDLQQAIENTLTVSHMEWKQVADVTTDYAPELMSVHCCPGELNQVLLGLIVNAAHAVQEAVRGSEGEKGRIIIATRRKGTWAEIEISDTGVGIAPEIRERIFEPFFTTKEVGKGTGQGLAMAYHVICDNYGGTIEVDSEPGRGAVFTLRLPLLSE